MATPAFAVQSDVQEPSLVPLQCARKDVAASAPDSAALARSDGQGPKPALQYPVQRALRPLRHAFGDERASEAPLASPERRLDEGEVDQVALGEAPAAEV